MMLIVSSFKLHYLSPVVFSPPLCFATRVQEETRPAVYQIELSFKSN